MPRMTVDLLCRCTGHARRKREEGLEQFLRRITHLYCSEKAIETIEGLSVCHNLTVLYLYDNFISRITSLSSCTSLTHLYLQNNHITKIENLGTLRRLSKLYLSGNAIMVVEGLEELSQLSELHIAQQRLPEGEKLLFDPRSIQAIAQSLSVLNVAGNGLDSLAGLLPLQELTHLNASDNLLADMKELSHILGQWTKLWKLELTGNPLCEKHKYRDRVITMCQHVGIVDGREVSELERQFLQNWKAMRKAQRRRRKRQMRVDVTGLIPPAQQILSTIPPPVPPTMPALPARQPLKTDWRKKQGTEQEEVRLPEIVQTSNSQRPPVLSSLTSHTLHKGMASETTALSWSPMKGSPQNTWRTVTTVNTFV